MEDKHEEAQNIWDLSLFQKIVAGGLSLGLGIIGFMLVMLINSQKELDTAQNKQIDTLNVDTRVLTISQQKLISATENILSTTNELKATMATMKEEQIKRGPLVQSIPKVETLLEKLTDRQIQLQIELAGIKNRLPQNPPAPTGIP